jgi:uncharacterized protein YbjT (DUF2867 family)
MKKALVVGATGLVGSHIVDELLKDDAFEEVHILVRKNPDISSPKLIVHNIDFEQLSDLKDVFSCDVFFCALGTTIKKAGSQKNFKKVDYTYVVKSAKLAKTMGALHGHVVTALGSNADSKIFYNRVKGEVQNQLKELDYLSMTIYQPSLLLGDRAEFRIGEALGAFFYKVLSFLFLGPLKKYKGIKGKDVARGMIQHAKREQSGFLIVPSHEILIKDQ